MRLFDLIMETQRLLDAIASHPEYKRLAEGNHLINLDVNLGDLEIFLMRLNQRLGEMTESEAGKQYPKFEEIFGEDALQNPVSVLPDPLVAVAKTNQSTKHRKGENNVK